MKLTKLGQLDLSYNKLVNFPDICNEHFVNLSEASLQNNEIVEIPDDIQQLVGLKHFNMSVNHITALPKALATISKLKGTIEAEKFDGGTIGIKFEFWFQIFISTVILSVTNVF